MKPFYITISQYDCYGGQLGASDPGDFDSAVDFFAQRMDEDPFLQHRVYRCEPDFNSMEDVTDDARQRVVNRLMQRGWLDSAPAWVLEAAE